MAKTQGTKNVEMVVIGDDISLPRSQGALVGRRGLAGMIIGERTSERSSDPLLRYQRTNERNHCLPHPRSATACKILGAASEEGLGFDLVLRLGRAISGAMASVCAALDHCHIPGRGRADGQHIDVGQVEIGLGLHNEKVHLHPHSHTYHLPYGEVAATWSYGLYLCTQTEGADVVSGCHDDISARTRTAHSAITRSSTSPARCGA
jgi:hypothetical protein